MKVIVGIGILLLVAVTLGWGVQQKNAAPVESGYITINHQGLRMLNGIPFSGVMITRYANGHVAALEAFEQGRRHGQTQKWFAFKFLGKDSEINVGTDNPEFSEWKWSNHNLLVENIVPFKRKVYAKVLDEFFDIFK